MTATSIWKRNRGLCRKAVYTLDAYKQPFCTLSTGSFQIWVCNYVGADGNPPVYVSGRIAIRPYTPEF